MEYSEKLKSPKWQKKRLQILERDNWECQYCKDTETQLQVHHLKYTNEPWDADNNDLITACSDCHQIISNSDFKYKSIIKMKAVMNNAKKFICNGINKDGEKAFIFIFKDEKDFIKLYFTNEQINIIKDLL
jgi:hypothetical protein